MVSGTCCTGLPALSEGAAVLAATPATLRSHPAPIHRTAAMPSRGNSDLTWQGRFRTALGSVTSTVPKLYSNPPLTTTDVKAPRAGTVQEDAKSELRQK